jgi:hypothetical protein
LLCLAGAGCITEKVPEPPHTYGHVKTLKEIKKKSPPKKADSDTTETMVTQ